MIRAILATPFLVLGLASWLVGGSVGAALVAIGERVQGERKS
jgi:hypothetical protein